MRTVKEIYGIEKQAFVGALGRAAGRAAIAMKGGLKGVARDTYRGAGVFSKNILKESKKGLMPAATMTLGGLTIAQTLPGTRQITQAVTPKGLQAFSDPFIGTGGYFKRSRELINKSNFGQRKSFMPMPPTRR